MLDDVYTFQKTFKCVQSDRLNLLLKVDRQRRFNLQKEEWNEYKLAVRHKDFPEMLDAIVDNVYIVLGTALAHGFKNFHEFVNINDIENTESIDNILFDMQNKYVNGNLTTAEILNYLVCIFDSIMYHFKEGVKKGYWKDDFDTFFQEVHSSNMSKLGLNGKPIFREDGKVLKGPNFVKPNMKQFIR